MHTITSRPPTPAEQRLIARRTKPDVASWGCLVIFFGIGPVYLLGKLGGWVGGFISEDASTYGQWVGWILAAFLFVSAVVMFLPYERRLRRKAARDEQERTVQEIHVIEPRVIEIEVRKGMSPIK